MTQEILVRTPFSYSAVVQDNKDSLTLCTYIVMAVSREEAYGAGMVRLEAERPRAKYTTIMWDVRDVNALVKEYENGSG